MYRRRFVRTLGAGAASFGTVGAATATQTRDAQGSPPHQGPDTGPLSVHQTTAGPQFVDRHGRTVTLRGVNVGRKTAPFVRTEAEFDETDVERIRSWGFNVVRLGVIWEGIAPDRDAVDDGYLARVRELVELFDAHGIHVLVDMHQDLYSRVFDGDGAPEWAVYTDGIPYQRSDPWQLDYADPAVARAFDNFWLDNHDLHAAYERAFLAVARAVRDVDGVVGYELFNEPSPGEVTAAGFEERYLPRFYERIGSSLRGVDPSTPVWVEPEGITNAGKPATLGEVAIDQLAYSFHNYADLVFDFANPYAQDRTDPVGYRNQEWVFANNRQRAETLGAVPVLTEFCPGNDTADTANLLDLADEYRTGWIYWAYRNWGTRTSGEAGTMVGHPDVVETLVRPYAPAVAGVPDSYGFDQATRTYSLRYRPWQRASKPTVLFLPASVYPDGYAVQVDGGHVTRRAGEYIWLRQYPRSSSVTVEVSPRG